MVHFEGDKPISRIVLKVPRTASPPQMQFEALSIIKLHHKPKSLGSILSSLGLSQDIPSTLKSAGNHVMSAPRHCLVAHQWVPRTVQPQGDTGVSFHELFESIVLRLLVN